MQQYFQRSLIPLDVAEIYSNTTGSADLSAIATCTNGRDYALKLISDGNGKVPATEMFCYELARKLQIATPHFEIIRMRDSSFAFGSAWEGGVDPVTKYLQAVDILKGTKKVRGLIEFLSKVYALDLFVNNIDRHFGNYLFRDSIHNSVIPLAYDFGRAWYAYDPFGYQALEAIDENTQDWHQIICTHGQFDENLALATLDAIQGISANEISVIINEFPNGWLSATDATEFVDWWSNGGMADRVAELKARI